LARSLDTLRWLHLLALSCVALLSAFAYLFVVSAGRFTDWPNYASTYFDMFAEGFRAGHLHLVQEPSPALLAKPKPLDPANVSLWIWDASYYRGKFYLYWGPAPAVLLACVKSLFGVHSAVGDEVVSFLFFLGRAIFGLLLIDLLVRRLFPKTPVWLAVVGALVFTLGNPSPFNLARGGPYEVAIVSAQCFLVAGTYFGLRAVVGGPSSMVHSALASTLWALAIASRGSLLPAVALMCFVTLVALRCRAPDAGVVRPLFALLLPSALLMACLALYNYARFNSFSEIGLRYQMTTRSFGADALYVPANIYSYALRPLFYDCNFPFVRAPWNVGLAGLAGWLAIVPGYVIGEPLGGALNSCPYLLFAGFAVLVAKKGSNQAITPRVYIAVILALMATVTLMPALPMWSATMRYLLDVMSGATLLATVGCFALWERIEARPAWLTLLVATPIVASATYSVAVGVLLGIEGYFGHFQQHNPQLLHAMQQKASLCR
jgi:hypothetical protein